MLIKHVLFMKIQIKFINIYSFWILIITNEISVQFFLKLLLFIDINQSWKKQIDINKKQNHVPCYLLNETDLNCIFEIYLKKFQQ